MSDAQPTNGKPVRPHIDAHLLLRRLGRILRDVRIGDAMTDQGKP
jgi:hypothetical protein